MITETKPIEEKQLNLWEMCQIAGKDGLDICDEIWDWGIYLDCGYKYIDDATEWYDKCMMLFALNFKVIKYDPEWYTVCNVAEFIHNNINVFIQFFNEENQDEYKPKNYDESILDYKKNEGFYDIFMQSMECLIAGGYGESDYKKLYELLTA